MPATTTHPAASGAAAPNAAPAHGGTEGESDDLDGRPLDPRFNRRVITDHWARISLAPLLPRAAVEAAGLHVAEHSIYFGDGEEEETVTVWS
jgi:hypothetical protein